MEIEDLPQALEHATENLDRHLVSSPQMPTNKMLFYARDVQQLLSPELPYRQGLIEVGLPVAQLNLFDALVEWAERTDALWQDHRQKGKGPHLIALEKDGAELRDELVAACRFYLRRDPSTQHELKAIMYGEGIADLILDLNSLATLIRSNRRSFSRHGYFDPAQVVERTRQLIHDLREARWEAEWDASRDALRQRRDRLFTLLHMRLIDICVAGQFRFHHDAEIYTHFMKAEPPALFFD